MKTKKNIRALRCIAAFVAAVLLVAPLAGCTESTPPVDALFIAAGITRNNTVIDETALTPFIESAVDNPGAVISACRVDGLPDVIFRTVIEKPETNYAPKIAEQERNKQVKRINSGLSNCVAASPEVDLMSVLFLAEDFFGSFSEEQRKVLFIHHSGISSAGLVNLASPYENGDVMLIDVPVEDVVQNLINNGYIPNLEGVKVVWSGFSKCGDEQAPLSRSYATKLMRLWEEILAASGAKVEFITEPKPTDSVSYGNKDIFGDLGLPPVTAIPIAPDELEPFHVDLTESDTECAVRFNPGKDTFVDAEAAEKELQSIAEEMLKYELRDYIVVGSTASFGDGDGRELSLKRAQRCADVLISAGIPSENITVIGLGKISHSKRARDVDDNGKFIEGIEAQSNRAVFIYPANSDFGKEVTEIC